MVVYTIPVQNNDRETQYRDIVCDPHTSRPFTSNVRITDQARAPTTNYTYTEQSEQICAVPQNNYDYNRNSDPVQSLGTKSGGASRV